MGLKMETPDNLPNSGKKLEPRAIHTGRQRAGTSNLPNPTPSRVINSVVQACEEIDTTIFSSLRETQEFTSPEENLHSISRILSPDLISRCENGLEMLSEEYLRGNFTPREFEQILNTLLVGVEKLEAARDQFDGDIESELRTCGEEAFLALENVKEAVEERCRILEKAFADLGKKLDEISG